MKKELDRVSSATIDRYAAYSLVRKDAHAMASMKSVVSDQMYDSTYDEEEEELWDEGGDTEYVSGTEGGSFYDNLSSIYSQTSVTDAQKSLDFLLASHDLQEPMLKQLIGNIQTREYKKLRRCQMRMRNAIVLVGAPDPFACLRAGEVYVCMPDLQAVQGKVLVTRNPLRHPGDIRVLQAVTCETFSSLLNGNTNLTVIFHSSC